MPFYCLLFQDIACPRFSAQLWRLSLVTSALHPQTCPRPVLPYATAVHQLQQAGQQQVVARKKARARQ